MTEQKLQPEFKYDSNNGLVAIRKMGGETYITITEKGEDISTKLLQELIAYGEFANMNKRNSDERVVPKGVAYDPGIKRFEKRLAERISEINSQYEDELETIGDE